MGHLIPLVPAPRPPKPEWLKVRAPGSPNYARLKSLMRELKLHTVCEEAQLPEHRRVLASRHGHVHDPRRRVHARVRVLRRVARTARRRSTRTKPARVAHAIHALDLSYVVVTSVDRDDLPDGGASIFADTIRQTRALHPTCRIEVLIPGFSGQRGGAADGARRAPGHAEPQHGNRSPAVPHGAVGRPLCRGRWNCSIGRAAMHPTSRPRPG